MKVLYFTDDFSQKNQDFAKSHGLTIRNKHAYGQIDFLEPCDAVCGEVPKAYLETYPVFDLSDEPSTKTVELTDEPDEQPKAKPKASRTKKEPV
ncbi:MULTISPECIES: hypothetical protein [unclassified Moraxella]|uniref:hypothetical protein n=1 Tax=unclassified Moraxella TaxID=2685852 RepID=UPI002B4052B6|nr:MULTISPECIES: hypothetical protein [unclassified Moraxella]